MSSPPGLHGPLVAGLFVASAVLVPASTVGADDEGLIVFESVRNGRREIWVMEPDGSDQEQLTDDKVEDLFPEWSPDGSRIAWVRGGRGPEGEIWVMNADGSAKTRLTSNLVSDSNPTWSPDGTQIAFRSLRDGNRDIYVMNADGTNERRLTIDPASDFAPDWSPDGARIAFSRDAPELGIAVYTMSAAGGDERRVTDYAMNAGPAGWSPDGSRLLVIDAFCATCLFESDLFIVAADGSSVAQVTDTDENEAGKSWSPDGGRIVFDRSRFTGSHLHKSDIVVLDLATGHSTLLTDTPNDSDEHPDWSG